MTETPPPGCPYHSAPATYGSSDLTYNDYLKVPELLGLQLPQSDPAHHDEMLFIVIHQAYELWFKLILHEMDTGLVLMREREVLRAHHTMKRVVEIMKLLVQQIHLLETMTPSDFLEFRDRLMPASGFQSIQFRELEFRAGLKDKRYISHFVNRPDLHAKIAAALEAPDLRQGYFDLLRSLDFKIPADAYAAEASDDSSKRVPTIEALRPIYQDSSKHLPLYLLSESLVEFDEYLSLWREHHVRVVERVIGFKRGTGGSSGVEYLRSTVGKRCFPSLWEVRTHLEKRST